MFLQVCIVMRLYRESLQGLLKRIGGNIPFSDVLVSSAPSSVLRRLPASRAANPLRFHLLDTSHPYTFAGSAMRSTLPKRARTCTIRTSLYRRGPTAAASPCLVSGLRKS